MLHIGAINTVRFDLEGKRIVTASDDGTVQLWDGFTGKPLLSEPLRHPAGVNAAEFSPDGRWVVTACKDGFARIWDSRLRCQIIEPLKCQDEVASAAISPDGGFVLATCEEEARVWALPNSKTDPPTWLPELLEAIAGRRANGAGISGLSDEVARDEFDRINNFISESSDSDAWTQWAKWILSDRHARTAFPVSTLTNDELLNQANAVTYLPAEEQPRPPSITHWLELRSAGQTNSSTSNFLSDSEIAELTAVIKRSLEAEGHAVNELASPRFNYKNTLLSWKVTEDVSMTLIKAKGRRIILVMKSEGPKAAQEFPKLEEAMRRASERDDFFEIKDYPNPYEDYEAKAPR